MHFDSRLSVGAVNVISAANTDQAKYPASSVPLSNAADAANPQLQSEVMEK